jgi:hypothetical protein
MNYTRTIVCLAAVVAAVACDKDTDPVRPSQEPVAYVRYVHAVPDTGATDWRPVDRVENSPSALGVGFRGSTPYQAMGVGTRRLRIFPTSSNVNVTSQILLDTTLTFQADQYYTLLWTGSARANTDFIVVIQDQRVQPTTDQVAIRAINAAPTAAAVDVYTAAPGAGVTPIVQNLAYKSASEYRTLTKGALTLRVTPTASTTVLASAAAPAGDAGNAALNQDPIAGATIGGSLLTAVYVPAGVAGSPNASVTTPGVIYLLDNRPPRS